MKDNQSVLSTVLVLVVLSVVACSKEDKDSALLNPDSKGDTFSQEYQDSYQFEFNGCKTGTHEFMSNSKQEVTEKLCTALQDEELNKFCATDLRKEHFEQKCSGKTWSPFVGSDQSAASSNNDDVENLPDNYQKRNLIIGQAVMDIPITTPNGTDEFRSELTFVSCFDSVEVGATSGYNGFILLGGSKAVIVRDTTYRFGDGTTASDSAPVSLISCIGERSREVTSLGYQARHLSVGQFILEVPITSPNNNNGEIRSEMTPITCVDDVMAGVFSGHNGLILMKGSKAVIMRDTSYRFGDGTSFSSAKPISVITCE